MHAILVIEQAHTVLSMLCGDGLCSTLKVEKLQLFALETLLPIIATALRRRAEATGRCQRKAGRVLLVNSPPCNMCFQMCTACLMAECRTQLAIHTCTMR